MENKTIVKTDIQIAQSADIRPIREIADKIAIEEEDLEYYGRHKAKIPLKYIDEEKIKKSKLILVTAINPTPAGEGKTTVSVGLCDGLNKIGKKAVLVLREPSLVPLVEDMPKLSQWRISTCILQEIFRQWKRRIIFFLH